MNPPAVDATTTFAMVGTGWMAAAIAPDFASCGFARLTTVVSRSRDRADAFATKFGVTATATVEELPALDVDVVHIATPHHNHAELACAALGGTGPLHAFVAPETTGLSLTHTAALRPRAAEAAA